MQQQAKELPVHTTCMLPHILEGGERNVFRSLMPQFRILFLPLCGKMEQEEEKLHVWRHLFGYVENGRKGILGIWPCYRKLGEIIWHWGGGNWRLHSKIFRISWPLHLMWFDTYETPEKGRKWEEGRGAKNFLGFPSFFLLPHIPWSAVALFPLSCSVFIWEIGATSARVVR